MELSPLNSGSASAPLILAVLVVVISYAFVVNYGRRRYSRPLPPGPLGVPILGNLPFLEPELHSHFARLAAVHGPVFRLHFGSKLGVVVSSAAAAREILRDQDAVFANHDVIVAGSAVSYGGYDIVWSPNGPTWRMLRKVCVRDLLAAKTLEANYGLRQREIGAMARRVAAQARKGEAIDIGKEMFVTAMNVITSMLWGGNSSGAANLGEEFKDVINGIADKVGQPNLSDFYPFLKRFDLQGIEKKSMALRDRVDALFERVVAAKEKNPTNGADGGSDFLDVMLRLEREGGDGKAPFTRMNTKGVLLDMISGGTDTSSNIIEFVMAEMMNQPETIRKVQEEMDEAVGRERMIEESEALKLRYLMAAIKEGLRLHPVLPLLIPHSPSEDCVVGDYTIPNSSRVMINAWAIHRDPETWEDPLSFKPERFLDDGGSASVRWDFSGNDLRYIPFGSGRRICAGSVMAERTMVHTLATLLHCFDWQLPDSEVGVDLQEKFGIILRKKKPLVLVPKLRLTNPALYTE